MEVLVERCAALDVHKDTVMACVRRRGVGRRREQEVREFRTWTSTLAELREWLAAERVSQVAMEATNLTDEYYLIGGSDFFTTTGASVVLDPGRPQEAGVSFRVNF